MIRTPKGQASKTEKRIRKWIIKNSRLLQETLVNKLDNKIIWRIEGTPKEVLKIQSNAIKFELMMSKLLNTKSVKKAIKKKYSEEEQKQFYNMVNNQTSVEVIKKATVEELTKDKSMWEKLKEKF